MPSSTTFFNLRAPLERARSHQRMMATCGQAVQTTSTAVKSRSFAADPGHYHWEGQVESESLTEEAGNTWGPLSFQLWDQVFRVQALWQGLWRWQGGCRNQVAPHVRKLPFSERRPWRKGPWRRVRCRESSRSSSCKILWKRWKWWWLRSRSRCPFRSGGINQRSRARNMQGQEPQVTSPCKIESWKIVHSLPPRVTLFGGQMILKWDLRCAYCLISI